LRVKDMVTCWRIDTKVFRAGLPNCFKFTSIYVSAIRERMGFRIVDNVREPKYVPNPTQWDPLAYAPNSALERALLWVRFSGML